MNLTKRAATAGALWVLTMLPQPAPAGRQRNRRPNTYAQQVVEEILARHSDLRSVELALVSGKACVTVAATALEDVGEACDADEKQPMRTGKPYVEEPTRNDPVYDITQALHDGSGALIGAVGMDIAPAGRSREAVLSQAGEILRELENMISSKEQLLSPAPAK